MKYKTFIKNHAVTCDITRVPFREDTTEFDGSAKHYMYSLGTKNQGNIEGSKIRGFYSQGSGIKEEPSTQDILNALVSDTQNLESFEDWAGDYGYAADSLKALQTFNACLREILQLKGVFNTKQLKELYSCEQL